MRKLYFIDPDQKKFEFHFSIIRLPMEKKKFEVENSMTSRIEKRVECKKKKFEVEILSRDYERTLTSDIGDSVCFARENSSCEVDGVVKKCWRAYATPAIRKLFRNLCLQSLALTKVSFNDFPLRYDSMGGSWNTSFRYGWFWMRCHFPISIFLTLGKAGWYCVIKGNIFFFVLLSLFPRDLFLSLKLTSKRCFSKN